MRHVVHTPDHSTVMVGCKELKSYDESALRKLGERENYSPAEIDLYVQIIKLAFDSLEIYKNDVAGQAQEAK